MFGAYGSCAPAFVRVDLFISEARISENEVWRTDLLRKQTIAVQKHPATSGKSDLIHNSAHPKVEVNPETYEFAQMASC